jgi:putative membrane protein
LATWNAWLPGFATMYEWIKALHIIAVIAWMAGMLYLPRLFVYHCAAEIGSVQSETFKVMERRLLRAIINPAMIATWVFGLALAWLGPDSRYGWFASGWLWAKIVLVLALSAVHGLLARWMKDFAHDRNRHSHKFYRIINEVPTVLMILIVLLVVLKPF